MTTPTYCSACGHELGIGRFCTNCGRPVPGRHPEAAPPAAAPPPPPAQPAQPAPVTVVTPPPSGPVPPSARYPLYADAPPVAPPVPPPAPPAPPAGGGRAGTPWLPWVAGLLVVAVIAGLGTFLLVGTGDDDTARDRDDTASSAPSDGQPDDDDGEAQPDSDGTGTPAPQPEPGEVVDLTTDLSAHVPATAPPSRDRQGRPVDFAAANMWDGDTRTAWRMPGDGTGQTLTFDLGRDVVLTEVGLVNGYAKIDGPNNWYRGNRRVLAVQWEFDDGTRITQDLAQRRPLQTIPIDPVASRTVTVNLLTVTEPGRGPSGRDFTAISEVHLRGAPA